MHVRLKHATLLALPALAHAVSLSEWTPRAVGLPPKCEAIYTETIPDCTVHDFSSGKCSTACLQSLEALVEPVKHACAGLGVTGRNLIVAFLSNVGPQQICPNAPVQTPSAAPSSPHGAPMQSTSSDWHGHHGRPSASSWSGTTTVSSLSPTDTHSLVVDTSSRTKHAPLPPKTQASTSTPTTSSSTRSAPSQLNTGDGSGGGSPFDTAGNLGSGAVALTFNAALAFLSGGAALFILR